MKNGIAIFALLALLINYKIVYAQDTQSASDTGMLSATSEAKMEEEYQLPYPGILPDNPLYLLKTTRDRIISFLISDPLKKSQFNLLQADKRLNAGAMLASKGKATLAESTIAKGENYFEDAIAMVHLAKKQGLETSGMVKRLSRSVKKHREVLAILEKKTDGEVKKSITHLEKRVAEFEKMVNKLNPK